MGSTNPVFILPEALKERRDSIAKDLAASVTQGVGQFCTNPGLVLVQQTGDEKAFKDSLSKAIGESPSGVMLTGAIHSGFEKGIDKLRNTKGVVVASQGRAEGEGYRGIAAMLETTVNSFLQDHTLEEEVFGPSTLLVTAEKRDQLIQAAEKLSGHLTATVLGTEKDLVDYSDLLAILEQKAGRVIINGYPTGVEVCHSMVHGGPFPATTDSRSTSVGTRAITRFTRPVCYQNFPQALLPEELRDSNPLNIWRMVNGTFQKN
jgi:NADP-dependent aldehyde dehydrogenase